MGRYDYKELLEKAMQTKSFEDCQALADWFDRYDPGDWTGTYYRLDNGKEMHPVYWTRLDGEIEIKDYTII